MQDSAAPSSPSPRALATWGESRRACDDDKIAWRAKIARRAGAIMRRGDAAARAVQRDAAARAVQRGRRCSVIACAVGPPTWPHT
eukprot:380429-Prymnesium_polylepis.1